MGGKLDKALKAKKIAKSKDPIITMASNLTAEYHKAVGKFQSSGAERRVLEGKVSKLIYEANKGKLPPDATFTLRIADGVVQGYNYNELILDCMIDTIVTMVNLPGHYLRDGKTLQRNC